MSSQAERPVAGPDRRQFPRVDLSTAVEVQGPQGARWTLSSNNISRRGLQVRCSREVALEVVRACRGAGPAGDALLQVRLRLTPAAASSTPFTADCRLVYARPTSAEEFALGLEYAGFEGESHEALQGFIVDCLRY
jgi:hypothetical protein